ncbi:MAG TPA: PP2C family protein-serine/threonine phosphatase, partial [Syntrophales bacterium]|nr:PP2C family protein-serine/threonine phosphatase [Syntrophales bacterium]
KPGDLLFLYTDGVTEAMNVKKDFYTEGRLKETLSAVRDLPVEDLVRTVKESVQEFAGQEPRADDMTMLALRFRGERG